MNYGYRVLSCLALLGMTLLALSQYRPSWAAQFGLDWWTIPELVEEIRRDEQKQAAISSRGQVTHARLRARGEIVHSLLAQRLTLIEAAARFRALNNAMGVASENELSHFSGATEEERLCRQVISWTETAARAESPSEAEPVRQRLEAELSALLARSNGCITLPAL